MLPFRLPTEKELIKDAGVEYLALSNIVCSKDILDGIGNCFYPKALQASYTSRKNDGLLEKMKLNVHLPMPAPISISEAVKEYEQLKQVIQASVEKQKKASEIIEKITPYIYPQNLQELATDDYLEHVKSNLVAPPKISENIYVQPDLDQEEAQNHKPVCYSSNKEATMLEELRQIIDPRILQLMAATKFYHNTYFDKLKQPRMTIEQFKAEVLLDVKTYCINRATMCLVINNENHPLRMADNVCLVYGPHYNKIQILILDSYKVRQGVVAINMRVSSQDANPFHVVTEMLKNTTLQFIVQPDSLKKVVNFHSYIQVHEADLFQNKENIHFEIHQSRKSQESRSEQFLKKNICPLPPDRVRPEVVKSRAWSANDGSFKTIYHR